MGASVIYHGWGILRASMALGAGFQRLAALHEADIVRRKVRFDAQVEGYDALQHSPIDRIVTFRRSDELVWTARAEPMARFVSDLGLLRWWWYGSLSIAKTRLDTIVAEGQRNAVDELTKDSVQTETLEDSDALCALAAHLAGAEAYVRIPQGEDFTYFALWDASRNPPSIAAPPPGSSVPAPALRASHSLAPAAPASPSATASPSASASPSSPPGAELSREHVSAVASEAIRVVQASLPQGFRQALVTVVVDAHAAKARIFTHLAALDAAGNLHSLDPSQRMFESVVALVSEHHRRAGASLPKIVLRLRSTERGASIELV
jgi:hypothetical protein